MLRQEKNVEKGSSGYAVASDFCWIFADEMDRLYLLSFLLTADGRKAEECFASALEDCLKANQVFRDWARSWARRAIIRNAIRLTHPASEHARQSPTHQQDGEEVAVADSAAPFAVLLGLNTLERQVFVLSVLERYSDQDCRVLLQCSRQEVALARNRAVEHMAKFADTPPLPTASGTGQAFAQAS